MQHKHQNPLIFLHGIHLGMLEQILEFIYTGKCEIRQDNLQMFLSCGKALGIQRLAGYAESETENTFKLETPIESHHIDTGKILAIDKCTNEENFEEIEQLRMGGAVDIEQIQTLHSESKTNEDGDGIVRTNESKTNEL